jgi:hypothetical protein
MESRGDDASATTMAEAMTGRRRGDRPHRPRAMLRVSKAARTPRGPIFMRFGWKCVLRPSGTTSGSRPRSPGLMQHGAIVRVRSNGRAARRHALHPRLAYVAIVGAQPPFEESAGHDLTYVAELGLLDPPTMPRKLLADLAGAERAATTACALLAMRERSGHAEHAFVSLRDAARSVNRLRTVLRLPRAISAARSRDTASIVRVTAGSPSPPSKHPRHEQQAVH